MRRILFGWLLLASLSLPAQAPEDEVGEWWLVYAQARVSDRWSVMGTGVFRFYELAQNRQHLFCQFAPGYQLGERTTLWAGWGTLYAYSFETEQDPKARTLIEQRLFAQLLRSEDWGRFNVQHRYGVDFRWFDFESGDRLITQRLRWRIRGRYVLGRPQLLANTFYLVADNEILMDIGADRRGQNWFSARLGRQFWKGVRLELGYHNQIVTERVFHRLRADLYVLLDLRKPREAHPHFPGPHGEEN